MQYFNHVLSDSYDIEDVLKRLDISCDCIEEPKTNFVDVSNFNQKKGNCDKGTLGTRMSKIATLLPKSKTIKGTIKMKRKHLFKKHDSRTTE